jgi:hypothetical protein
VGETVGLDDGGLEGGRVGGVDGEEVSREGARLGYFVCVGADVVGTRVGDAVGVFVAADGATVGLNVGVFEFAFGRCGTGAAEGANVGSLEVLGVAVEGASVGCEL